MLQQLDLIFHFNFVLQLFWRHIPEVFQIQLANCSTGGPYTKEYVWARLAEFPKTASTQITTESGLTLHFRQRDFLLKTERYMGIGNGSTATKIYIQANVQQGLGNRPEKDDKAN